MAAGEPGDHGPPIVPPTVCENERGGGYGGERALIPLRRETGMTVEEIKWSRIFVVRT